MDWEQVSLRVGDAAVLEDCSGGLPSFRRPAAGLILLQYPFSQLVSQASLQALG